MTQGNLDWVKKIKDKYSIGGRVLDIGSFDVNGSPRSLFEDADQYVGVDFREGPGVDMVMDAHDLGNAGFWGGEFDTVICMNTLEHDSAFWLTLKNIDYLLKQGGYFIFCIPTIGFPVHDYPGDYWRMTEQAIKEYVFNPQIYELLEIETQYTKEDEWGDRINPVICAVGRKL